MLDTDTDAADYSFGPAKCEENIRVSNFVPKSSKTQKCENYLLLHMNVRSLTKNVDKIENLQALLPHSPEVIVVSETELNDSNRNLVSLPNYQWHCVNSPTNSGAIGMYVSPSLTYKILPNLSLSIGQVEDIWVEIQTKHKAKLIIMGGIYFHSHSTITEFQNALALQLKKFNAKGFTYYILGDFNMNSLSQGFLTGGE